MRPSVRARATMWSSSRSLAPTQQHLEHHEIRPESLADPHTRRHRPTRLRGITSVTQHRHQQGPGRRIVVHHQNARPISHRDLRPRNRPRIHHRYAPHGWRLESEPAVRPCFSVLWGRHFRLLWDPWRGFVATAWDLAPGALVVITEASCELGFFVAVRMSQWPFRSPRGSRAESVVPR